MDLYDKHIRKALYKYIEKEWPEYFVKDELSLSENFVRSDIALIGNDHMFGIEIKSDRDNLKRLPTQAYIYTKYFKKCYIATTSKYLEETLEVIPEEWGVFKASAIEEEIQIELHREAKENHEINPMTLLQLLNRKELRDLSTFLGHKKNSACRKGELIYNITEDFKLEYLGYLTCLLIRRRSL